MTFEEMIGKFEQAETKTASAATPTNAATQLQEAVNAVAEKTAAEAPAAEADAVSVLEKMAAEMAGTEKNAELEHAHALGMAFSDGAISQWESYRLGLKQAASEAAVQDAVKTAAVQGYNDALAVLQQEMPAKTAQYAPQTQESDVGELLKQAAIAGDPDAAMKLAEYNAGAQAAVEDLREYQQTGVLKTAAAMEYEQGQVTALEDAHQLGTVEFLKGAAEAEILVRAMHNAE